MAEVESLQVPFNVVDEVVHVLDCDAEPRTIQLEVRTEGALDEGRLRTALAAGNGRGARTRVPEGRTARRRPGNHRSVPGRVGGRPGRHRQI